MIANFITKNHPVSKIAREMGFMVETEANSQIRLILRKEFNGDMTAITSDAVSKSNFLISYSKDNGCSIELFRAIAVDGLTDVVLTISVPFEWYWKRVNKNDSIESNIIDRKEKIEFGYMPGR